MCILRNYANVFVCMFVVYLATFPERKSETKTFSLFLQLIFNEKYFAINIYLCEYIKEANNFFGRMLLQEKLTFSDIHWL